MWTLDDYVVSDKLQRCANEGVRKAREAAKKAGLPIVFDIDGRIYYELADGTITEDRKVVDKVYAELKK